MTLIRTSFLSLIATIFKITYGLVLNKLLAIYVGPAGVALVGQFQSLQSGCVGIATAGFGQGLTKYLAEFREDVQRSSKVFATATKLVSLVLLPLLLFLFFFSGWISDSVFYTDKYDIWIKGLAVSLIPTSLGALFVASLNGLGEIRSLTLVGVLSSCLGIVLTLFLVPHWGTNGVVISLLTTPLLVLMMSAWYLKKSRFFSWSWFNVPLSREEGWKLGKFVQMALVSATSVHVSHMLIRNYLTYKVSLDAAGLWTGMWRISEAYLMVITMTLSVYYLPKLSALNEKKDLIAEMKNGYKIIMPFVICSSILVFLCKDWIIQLLFSPQFYAMRNLFFWQFVVGDVLKIASFLMGYLLIAKGMAKIFIVKELAISVLFVLLTWLFVESNGLIGVTHAYVVIYLVNFIWLAIVMRWYFKDVSRQR